MQLGILQAKCMELATEKGWNEKAIPFPEMCSLLHSEISEALEAFREHLPINFTGDPETDKPVGIASEFADLFIRLCHYCSRLGIDLESATIQKLRYNVTRPHRHGGKAC